MKSISPRVPNTTCEYVMFLPFEKRCEFVFTDSCSFQDPHILQPYRWIFCAKDEAHSYIGVVFMFVTLLFLFLMISIVADAFVCPCVAVMAESLQLSDNIAGVTLLALGNGCPDLFASFAGASLDHPEVLYAGLTGSALFVSCLISGMIIWSRPFHVDAWPIVVNITFLLLSYTILFSGFFFRNFNLAHCIAMIGVYVIYIAVTVVDEIVKVKTTQLQDVLKKSVRGGLEKHEPLPVLPRPLKKQRASVAIEVFLEYERRKSLPYRPSMDEGGGYSWRKAKPLFKEFLEVITPFTKQDWIESSAKDRILLIVQGFNQFWMKFFVPVVNPELPRRGWCKLLIMINLALYPCFVVSCMGYGSHRVFGYPLRFVIMPFGIVGSVIIFFMTKSYAVPKNHDVFAILGFMASVLMIRVMAEDVIIHLQTIGARFNLSQAFLALTCLAFGNSLGDLVINYGLAKQGMQNMGFAACFGGSMFNCSLGVGLIGLVVLIKTGKDVDEYYGALSPGAALYLFIAIFSCLIILVMLNFEARASFGLFLILLYVIYIFHILLMEKVIHPFGTQYFRHRRYVKKTP